MASRRPVVLLGALAIVALLVGASWLMRATHSGAGTAAPSTPTTTAREGNAPARPDLPQRTSSHLEAANGIPGLIPADQPPPPPSPDDPPPKPRPERKLRTPAEELEMKKEAVKLLDRNIARLEGDLATAEKSSDTKTAGSLRVRLERLRETRKRQAAEVDQASSAP